MEDLIQELFEEIDKDLFATIPQLCQRCNSNNAAEDHVCPYQDEINGIEKFCNCCSDCEHECLMDI